MDDTRETSEVTYGPALLSEMEAIAQYRVTRNKSYKWARSLSFLVYDDGECFDDWSQTYSEHLDAVKKTQEKRVEERSADPGHDDVNLQQAIELSLMPNDEQMDAASEAHQEQPVSASQHPKHAARVVADDDDGLHIEGQASTDKPYDSDNEDEMISYAVALSLKPDDDNQDIIVEANPPTGITVAPSQKQAEEIRKLDDSSVGSCFRCRSCPGFPAKRNQKTSGLFDSIRGDPTIASKHAATMWLCPTVGLKTTTANPSITKPRIQFVQQVRTEESFQVGRTGRQMKSLTELSK